MPAYDGLNPLATWLIWEELSHSTINTQKLFIHIIMSFVIYSFNDHKVAQILTVIAEVVDEDDLFDKVGWTAI